MNTSSLLNYNNGRRSVYALVAILGLAISGITVPARAEFILSTKENVLIDGTLNADKDDLVEVSVPSVYLDGAAVFNGGEDISAVHVISTTKFLLSTDGDADIGTLSFTKDDIVEYDAVTDTATIIFQGDLQFEKDENIDALHLLPSGNLLI